MAIQYQTNIDSSGLDGFVSTQGDNTEINYGQEISSAASTIASALDNINSTLGTINTTLTGIASDITLLKNEAVTTDSTLAAMSSTLSAVSTDIDRIRQLGDTSGIGYLTRGLDQVSTALMWKTLIVEGFMNQETAVTSEEQATAIAKINEYIQDYNNTFGGS
jgi:uncharacterized phage infection (PIP) family protein YhgE